MDAEKPTSNPCAPPAGFKGPVHTTGGYWGGHVLPYWAWLLFAIFPFTGFFGIDHLLFRSPTTAMAKGLLNIVTLGSWYFYDIFQGLADREYVKNYGLSTPFGPKGLAFQYFSGVSGEDTMPRSSVGFLQVFMFVLFCFSVFTPFGAPNFLAGDISGAMIKALWSVILFLAMGPLLVSFVGGVHESYRLLTNPQDVFEKGASRLPLNKIPRIHIDPFGLSRNLMTPSAYAKEAARLEKANMGFFSRVLASLGLVKQLPVVGQVVAGAEAGAAAVGQSLEKGGKAIGAIIGTGADVVTTGAQVAKAATGAAAALTAVPGALAQGVAAAKAAVPEPSFPPLQAPVPMFQAGPPQGSKDMKAVPRFNAAPPRGTSVGGGRAESSSEPTPWDGVVAGGIGVLALGGIATSLFRNALRDSLNGSSGLERNFHDTPPRPGVF